MNAAFRSGTGPTRPSRFAARLSIAACVAIACAVGLFVQPAGAATTRSGTLRATVFDDFRHDRSATRYTLKSGERETVVRPTELAAEPGDRVAVTGRVSEGRLVGEVEATSEGVEEVSAGPRKVAVLHFTFSGEPGEPWPLAETRAKVFTAADSASAFYEEESYGGISLTGKLDPGGDVSGWLSIDTPNDECQLYAWKEAAEAAADAEGTDLTGYDHVVYLFPHQDSCAWLGIAAVGGDWSMINGNQNVHVIAHELGHNLGLHHAGSQTCTAGGVRVQISDECTVSEYGDPFDAMGNIAARHNNGLNLDKLEILAPENVETIDATGAYPIRSALNPTAEPTVLRIPQTGHASAGTSNWYYLEVRETGGVFENVTDASTTGVSIRATASVFLTGAETALLDANPATAGFADAPLGVGQTFDAGPVAITTDAVGGGSATVSVEIDEEPPSAPTGVTATTGPDGVQVQWDAATDDVGVAHYRVFRDGFEIAGIGTGASFLDFFSSAGEHSYAVYAEDVTRNRSPASDPATATVPELTGPTCTADTCTVTYRSSGDDATWTVPAGVDEVEFTVAGARGGADSVPLLFVGRGAWVVATLGGLTAGEELTVSAGGAGGSYGEGRTGGFNGGGDGSRGAGGGGFSSVRRGPALVLLAGGGGGRGQEGFEATAEAEPNGGSGGRGGEIGTPGFRGASAEALGATLGGGDGGASGGSGGAGGSGGEATGAGGCSGGAFAGAAGAPGDEFEGGGKAAGAGGGGGGGYAGGGQGGGGAGDECGSTAGAGGGGGGSSYVAPELEASADFTGGIWRGSGQVSIAYVNPIAPVDRVYTTEPDRELVVPAETGVFAGGSLPSGVALSTTVVTPPAHGALALGDDGSFSYAPDPGYLGGDSFVYWAEDPTGDYATATVTLAVAEPPEPTPPARNDRGSTAEPPPPLPLVGPPVPSAPSTISIRRARVPVVGRFARVRLACRGGAPGSVCRGALRLSIAGGKSRGVRLAGSRRYALGNGKARWVAVRLRPWVLRGRERAGRRALHSTAVATAASGFAHRAVLLRIPPRRRGLRAVPGGRSGGS